MGFPDGIMIFLSAIVLAVSLNHLFLAFRLKLSLLHFTIFAAGLLGFALCIAIYMGYHAEADVRVLQRIYRVHLVLMQLSLLFLLLSYARLVNFNPGKWLTVVISFFILIALVTALLPADILYTSHSGAAIVILLHTPVTSMSEGLIFWRLLADLSLVGAAFFSLRIWMHQLARHSSLARPQLFILTVLLFAVAIADHLIDSGAIAFVYTFPLGFFIAFGMLSASSLDNMMQEASKNVDLEMEERKWKLMANEMKLLIVELNTLGQAKYVNPFLLELTGYKESEVIGKDWFEMLLPPSHAYEVQSAFLEILANDFHPVYHNPIRTKYDEERIIMWHNVRLRDRLGKITGSISIGMDITDMQDKIDNLEDSLSEARKIIDRLKNTGE